LSGLHSSDPATVYLAAWARVAEFTREDLDRALYEDRSLVRMLGMRRTMFVVTRDGAATMDAACTKALAERERRRNIQLVEDAGFADDGAAFVDRVTEATLQALRSRGEATAAELKEDVPELDLKLEFGEGKTWQGTVGLSTRMLFLLAGEGKIVRGRPLGSWISSQYRWAPTESWLGAPLPERDVHEARADLAAGWLRTFGPGTELDLKWWTGWNLGPTRRALAEVDVAVDPVEPPEDWVALLPALDPTVMGWKERDWYLGDHAAQVFDRNGNAGPTIWWNGRVVGGWSQRPDGTVVYELLEQAPKSLIEEKAVSLTEWLDGVVVTPRFRTPLEKRLSS
jgi:DNA glycosylase AlkZ-like